MVGGAFYGPNTLIVSNISNYIALSTTGTNFSAILGVNDASATVFTMNI